MIREAEAEFPTSEIEVIQEALAASAHIRECADHPQHLFNAEFRARNAMPALSALSARLETAETVARNRGLQLGLLSELQEAVDLYDGPELRHWLGSQDVLDDGRYREAAIIYAALRVPFHKPLIDAEARAVAAEGERDEAVKAGMEHEARLRDDIDAANQNAADYEGRWHDAEALTSLWESNYQDCDRVRRELAEQLKATKAQRDYAREERDEARVDLSFERQLLKESVKWRDKLIEAKPHIYHDVPGEPIGHDGWECAPDCAACHFFAKWRAAEAALQEIVGCDSGASRMVAIARGALADHSQGRGGP